MEINTKNDQIRKLIKSKLEENREWMITARRHLHMYPEVGDEEFKTTEYIEALLNEIGIKTQRLLPTGLVGILEAPEGTAGGKCIAIRADIDALPMPEETGLEF